MNISLPGGLQLGKNVAIVNAVFNPGDLEHWDLRIYEEFRPHAVVREAFQLYDAPGVEPWHESLRYDMFDISGGPERGYVSSFGNAGIPIVNAKIVPKSKPVKDVIYGIILSKKERRAAAGVGRDPETVLGNFVAYLLARDENDLFFNGQTDLGVSGLSGEATAIVGTTGNWASATDASTAYEDLRKGFNVVAGQDGVRVDQLALFLHTSKKAQFGRFISNTNPNLTLGGAVQQAGWFPAGIFFTETIPSTVGYVVSVAPEHCQLGTIQDIERDDPVMLPGGGVLITWSLRTAGPVLRYPLAAGKFSGI